MNLIKSTNYDLINKEGKHLKLLITTDYNKPT
jgi:hypothetical protein